MHGLLLTDVGTSEKVNTSVTEGLVHDHNLKNCKLIHSEYQMTLCFKHQGYGYIAVTSRKLQMYGICAKQHPTATRPTSNDLHTRFRCNCKGKHCICDPACPMRKADAEPATAAYKSQPSFYKILVSPYHLSKLCPFSIHTSPFPMFCCKPGSASFPSKNYTKMSTPIHCSYCW